MAALVVLFADFWAQRHRPTKQDKDPLTSMAMVGIRYRKTFIDFDIREKDELPGFANFW